MARGSTFEDSERFPAAVHSLENLLLGVLLASVDGKLEIELLEKRTLRKHLYSISGEIEGEIEFTNDPDYTRIRYLGTNKVGETIDVAVHRVKKTEEARVILYGNEKEPEYEGSSLHQVRDVIAGYF